MKEDINNFLDDLANNTPHEGQFKDVDKLKDCLLYTSDAADE